MAYTRFLALIALVPACGGDADPCDGVTGACIALAAGASQTEVQTALIKVEPGGTVAFAAGTFSFTSDLSLDVDGVTVRGAGRDATILSFKDQTVGPQGMLVTANDFLIHDIALEDSPGDALKVLGATGVTIRDVRVEWTGGPKETNGAYGLYPVQCTDVVIEDSIVEGASDAGIYVGQSKNVVVRRNRAERNVAGIEIENSIGADVYENTATDNTGGILVFNMPNLPQPGHTTRVYRNKVIANNTGNFAAKGAAVASVPAGSGVVINSNDRVEIFDNDIADNQTANVIVSSYFSTGYMNEQGVAKAFDPYPEEIHIHDNRFKGGGDKPDGLDLKALKVAMFGLNGRLPDVLWDGYVNNARAGGAQVCVDNGAATTLNADGPNKYKNPRVVTEEVRCALPGLPVVNLPGNDAAPSAKAAPAA